MEETSESRENFKKGFWVDEEWIGGISESPQVSGNYIAFVLERSSGACLGQHEFKDIGSAIDAIRKMNRNWKFETCGGCGENGCESGECEGSCARGACPI